MKFIGDRLLRKEDPRLVQGRGRYVGDITLPGMLHAAIVLPTRGAEPPQ